MESNQNNDLWILDKQLDFRDYCREFEICDKQLADYQALKEYANSLDDILKSRENDSDYVEGSENRFKNKIEALTHIGSNFFVKTSIDDPNIVLVNLGANIYMEYTLSEVLSLCDSRISELEVEISDLEKKIAECTVFTRLISQELEAKEKERESQKSTTK